MSTRFNCGYLHLVRWTFILPDCSSWIRLASQAVGGQLSTLVRFLPIWQRPHRSHTRHAYSSSATATPYSGGAIIAAI